MGLTRAAATAAGSPPVHPHVRGAHCANATTTIFFVGPSPRAWGSRATRIEWGALSRSIPTCVGLTCPGFTTPCLTMVHPHVRGAHRPGPRQPERPGGPSPRAWGSLPRHCLGLPLGRSIPTCVGLTSTHSVPAMMSDGPSPRAWGSLRRLWGAHGPPRSIPTCVGLTSTGMRSSSPPSVHPHVRGAHSGNTTASPRGNRSIPTCVGLTLSTSAVATPLAVHPHVRGAHFWCIRTHRRWCGPSPRAWGSL